MNEWTFPAIPETLSEIAAKFAKIRKISANQHVLCFIWKFLNVSWNSRQNSSKFCWKITKTWKFRENFWQRCKKCSRSFCWKFEIWAVQRYANLVDLEKCCKMRLFSLSQLSIQTRTSLSKFWDDAGMLISSITPLPATQRCRRKGFPSDRRRFSQPNQTWSRLCAGPRQAPRACAGATSTTTRSECRMRFSARF